MASMCACRVCGLRELLLAQPRHFVGQLGRGGQAVARIVGGQLQHDQRAVGAHDAVRRRDALQFAGVEARVLGQFGAAPLGPLLAGPVAAARVWRPTCSASVRLRPSGWASVTSTRALAVQQLTAPPRCGPGSTRVVGCHELPRATGWTASRCASRASAWPARFLAAIAARRPPARRRCGRPAGPAAPCRRRRRR